jgi:hypothetical protein
MTSTRSKEVSRKLSPVIAGAAIAALAACFSQDPAPPRGLVDLHDTDVIGAWRNVATGEVLRFEADGQFTTANLPYQMYEHYFPEDLPRDFDPAQDKLPASGEWLLGRALGNPEGPRNTITLRVHTLAGSANRTSFDLRAEVHNGVVFIAYYIGDPDLGNRIRVRLLWSDG